MYIRWVPLVVTGTLLQACRASTGMETVLLQALIRTRPLKEWKFTLLQVWLLYIDMSYYGYLCRQGAHIEGHCTRCGDITLSYWRMYSTHCIAFGCGYVRMHWKDNIPNMSSRMASSPSTVCRCVVCVCARACGSQKSIVWRETISHVVIVKRFYEQTILILHKCNSEYHCWRTPTARGFMQFTANILQCAEKITTESSITTLG